MVELIYKLSDNTIVRTQKDAKASGLRYEKIYSPIKETLKLTPKRAQMLKEKGVIIPPKTKVEIAKAVSATE